MILTHRWFRNPAKQHRHRYNGTVVLVVLFLLRLSMPQPISAEEDTNVSIGIVDENVPLEEPAIVPEPNVSDENDRVSIGIVDNGTSPPVDDPTGTPDPSDSDAYTLKDREICRRNRIADWLDTSGFDYQNAKTENIEMKDSLEPNPSPETQKPSNINGLFNKKSLMAIRETSLYKTIMEDCGYFAERYNAAAGTMCDLDSKRRYSNLWNIGPINMDAGWLLAADLFLSNNLRDSKALVPCSDSCYVRYPSLEDCQANDDDDDDQLRLVSDVGRLTSVWVGDVDEYAAEMIFSYPEHDFLEIMARREGGFGDDATITDSFQEQNLYRQKLLCDLGWMDIDAAYQDLRVCASESNVARIMIADRDDGKDTVSETTKAASAVADAIGHRRRLQAECSNRMRTGICAYYEASDYEPDPNIGIPFDDDLLEIEMIFDDEFETEKDDRDNDAVSGAASDSVAGLVASMGITAATATLFIVLAVASW